MKDRLWPLRTELLCQFWPQFLDMVCHPVREPLMETEWMSPAPATLVTRTRMKYVWPLMVNLIPPFFAHGTLLPPQPQYLLTNPESYGTNPYSLLQLLNLKGPFGKQE